MMEDKTLKAINLGQRADQILKELDALDVFEAMRRDVISGLARATTDVDRVIVQSDYVAIDKLRNRLSILISNGKIAKASLPN
jgi:hypothetical protein